MIRIFNNKIKKEILIDDSLDIVIFSPRDYDQNNPHILIDLKNIYFSNHAQKCNDCNSLLKAFGTNTTNWFIEYNGNKKRLNLQHLDSKFETNKLTSTISEWFSGTKMKLVFDTDTVVELEKKLKQQIENEDYKGCSLTHNKIVALKEE